MISSEIMIGIIGFFSTVASAAISWFSARKKYNAEVDKNVIENMKESMQFYDELTNNNKDKIHEVVEENKELRKEVNELTKENQQLKLQLQQEKEENKRRDLKIDELNRRLNTISDSICTDLLCEFRKNRKTTKTNRKKNDEKNNASQTV